MNMQLKQPKADSQALVDDDVTTITDRQEGDLPSADHPHITNDNISEDVSEAAWALYSGDGETTLWLDHTTTDNTLSPSDFLGNGASDAIWQLNDDDHYSSSIGHANDSWALIHSDSHQQDGYQTTFVDVAFNDNPLT